MSFDFIFAAEEYGTFQCAYSDAFAFFLTNLATNTTTNLAVIPGVTPPTPIAVTTIRKNEFNSGCTSENPTYFDKFYGTGNPQNGLPDVIAPTNFKGYTVPIIPGDAARNPSPALSTILDSPKYKLIASEVQRASITFPY